MATHKSEKYCRIMYMLSFGCTKVTRSYIMKTVRDTSPSGHNPSPWTLDDFLKHNKNMIDNTYFGSRRELQMRLFPRNGGTTDIESWDLLCLCFVFLELCNPPFIVQMDYGNFKTMRNSLCHSANGVLSDSEYSVCMVQLTFGIRRCLADIQDPVLTTEIEEAITAIETDATLQMERFMETELKGWYTAKMAALARVEQGIGRVELEVQQTTKTVAQHSEGISQLTEAHQFLIKSVTALTQAQGIQIDIPDQGQVFPNNTELSQDTKGDGVTEFKKDIENSKVLENNTQDIMSTVRSQEVVSVAAVNKDREETMEHTKIAIKQTSDNACSEIKKDDGRILSEYTNLVENIISPIMPERKPIQSEVTETRKLGPEEYQPNEQETSQIEKDAGSMLSEYTHLVENVISSMMPERKQVHSEVTETSTFGPKEYQPIETDTSQIEKGTMTTSTVQLGTKRNVDAIEHKFTSGKIEIKDGYHPVPKRNFGYFPTKVLGRGSQAIVYEGEFGQFDPQPIAVKIMTFSNKEEAVNIHDERTTIYKEIREIQTMETLNKSSECTNIIRFFDSYIHYDRNKEKCFVYLAFKLAKGTLRDYVEPSNRSWQTLLPVLTILREIVNGLTYIHDKNIVHRDLKPDNILIVEQSPTYLKAVIGDFGSAKATDGSMFTSTNKTGSVGFIAPEIWKVYEDDPESLYTKFNRRSDIFSLALVMYFALSFGKYPFGKSLVTAQVKFPELQLTFQHLSLYPNSLAQEMILRCMLDINPDGRPRIEEISDHPALWPSDRIMQFFYHKSDEFEAMIKADPAKENILEDTTLVKDGNWFDLLPSELQKTIRSKRERKTRIRYLLREIRNTASHHQAFSEDARNTLGTYPDGHIALWLGVFRGLLMHVYDKLGPKWIVPRHKDTFV